MITSSVLQLAPQPSPWICSADYYYWQRAVLRSVWCRGCVPRTAHIGHPARNARVGSINNLSLELERACISVPSVRFRFVYDARKASALTHTLGVVRCHGMPPSMPDRAAATARARARCHSMGLRLGLGLVALALSLATCPSVAQRVHDRSKCLEDKGHGLKFDADCIDCDATPRVGCAGGFDLVIKKNAHAGHCHVTRCYAPVSHFLLARAGEIPDGQVDVGVVAGAQTTPQQTVAMKRVRRCDTHYGASRTTDGRGHGGLWSGGIACPAYKPICSGHVPGSQYGTCTGAFEA